MKRYTEKDIARLMVLAQDTVSLNSPVIVRNGETADETELGNLIKDDSPGPEDIVIEEERKRIVATWLKMYLSPREELILRMRFGMYENEEPMTLEQVGLRFGVTRERIRQVEKKALRKLKLKLLSRGIKQEDL